MKHTSLLKILRGVACIGAIEGINIADIETDIIKRYDLKIGTRLGIQSIGTDNTISNDRTSYSLNGATPHSVFATGATCTFDGIDLPCPETTLSSKRIGDETLLIQHSQDGSIEGIMVYSDTGDVVVEYEKVDDSMFVPIESRSIDFDSLNKKFHYGNDDQETPRKLESVSSPYQSVSREATSACTSFKEIELAIAYESSFCSRNGGAANANNKAQAIVAGVSIKYQQTGLCTKVTISHLEGHCNTNTDPYASMVALNQSGCGTDGLLNRFTDYWNQNRANIRRDDTQLFSGTGLECNNNGSCVIGCAYVGCLCNSCSYGVNYATFSSNSNSVNVLVAHELGHNCGASHYNVRNHIMYPSVNAAASGFSQTSRTSFLNQFAQSSCIGNDGPTPTVSPVRRPSLAPVRTPTKPPVSPVRKPSIAPVRTPTKQPVSPVRKPSLAPVRTPTKPPVNEPNACKDYDEEIDCEDQGCFWDIKRKSCKDCSKSKKKKKCTAGGCVWDKEANNDRCSSCSVATNMSSCIQQSCVWKNSSCISCRAGKPNKNTCEDTNGCAWKRNKCISCRELKKNQCEKKGCSWNKSDGICNTL